MEKADLRKTRPLRMENKERYRGCLLGLAVGDAIGSSLEFNYPGCFEPITDMIGGGPFNLNPCEWTDDTSMALCLAESLITKKEFDSVDQLERYVMWFEEGHLSSNGVCFDIGTTILSSLMRFRKLETHILVLRVIAQWKWFFDAAWSCPYVLCK